MRLSHLIVLLSAALLACAFALAPATATAQSGEGQGWSDTAVVMMTPDQVPNLTTPIPADQNPMGATVISMNETNGEVCYQLWVSGIPNVTQAHIHQGAPGVEGPIVVSLYPSTDPNRSSGDANTTEHPGNFSGLLMTGNISASDLVGPMAGMTVNDLISAMRSGELYVNVHTVQNPGGEIRGQITNDMIWTSALAVPLTPLEEPTLTAMEPTWNISDLQGSDLSMGLTPLVGKNIGDAPWGIGLVQPSGSNVHYAIWTFDITNVTQAHFHMGPRGAEAPVVAWLYPSPTATDPANITPEQAGMAMNGKLIEGNVSEADLVGPLEGMPISALLDAMGNGTIYINVHTTQNPGGEIRGQVDPANMTCQMASAPMSPMPSPQPSPPVYATNAE